MKVDYLVFGAHPDDVEGCAGGFVLKARKEGKKVAIVDFTRGEMASNGETQERDQEAKKAAQIIDVQDRVNLNLQDSRLCVDEESVKLAVEKIREYRPEILLLPYWEDPHPDHAAMGKIGLKAEFYSRLKRYETKSKAHSVESVISYMMHTEFKPSFILDITDVYEKKREALFVHKSQIFKKTSSGEYSKEFINKDYVEYWEARARCYGFKIGVKYGEAYLVRGSLALNTVSSIAFGNERTSAVAGSGEEI